MHCRSSSFRFGLASPQPPLLVLVPPAFPTITDFGLRSRRQDGCSGHPRLFLTVLELVREVPEIFHAGIVLRASNDRDPRNMTIYPTALWGPTPLCFLHRVHSLQARQAVPSSAHLITHSKQSSFPCVWHASRNFGWFKCAWSLVRGALLGKIAPGGCVGNILRSSYPHDSAGSTLNCLPTLRLTGVKPNARSGVGVVKKDSRSRRGAYNSPQSYCASRTIARGRATSFTQAVLKRLMYSASDTLRKLPAI